MPSSFSRFRDLATISRVRSRLNRKKTMALKIESSEMPTAKESRFITTLLPSKNSVPIEEEYLKDYWLHLEPRRNLSSKVEDAELARLTNIATGHGYPTFREGSSSAAGPFNSLILAEGDPERILSVTGIGYAGFIEDDVHDGEVFLVEKDGQLSLRYDEHLRKTYDTIAQQLKSQVYIEALDRDTEVSKYVESYEDWMRSQINTDSMKATHFRSIEEYLEERIKIVGGIATIMLIDYTYQPQLTPEERESTREIGLLAVGIGALLNDWISADLDWILLVLQGEDTLPDSNLVFCIMNKEEKTFSEAKNFLKEYILGLEERFLELRTQFVKLGASSEVKRYLDALMLVISGAMVWQFNSKRYGADSRDALYPKPDYVSADFIRLVWSRASDTHEASSQEPTIPATLSTCHHEVPIDTPAPTPKSPSRAESVPAWLDEYDCVDTKTITEPAEYVASLPSKRVRDAAIKALDVWYDVPRAQMEIILSIVDKLHNSSLMFDDIQDNSELRRGHPAAHMIFGIPQVINSASYQFVACLEEVSKLGTEAISIYADELRNLHVGQGSELSWTYLSTCPTEADYIKMIDGKTGGLFRMTARLMRSQATKNKTLDVTRLLTLLGRFFQIRDDYYNLFSKDYSISKGDLSDLDEGKYSFLIIHALNNTTGTQLSSLLQQRVQKGVLNKQQKELVMKIISRCGTAEYTMAAMEQLQAEVHKDLEKVESIVGCKSKNWIMRAIMARLKVGN